MPLLVFLLLGQLANPTAFASDKSTIHAALAQTVCSMMSQGTDCQVTDLQSSIPSDDDQEKAHNHFYANIVMSWEHTFGEAQWNNKLFYNGAYRMVDQKTGRQYEFFRFSNELGFPINETNDLSHTQVHFADYINDIKIYQTQQADKTGQFAGEDDALTLRSKFLGEVVDENDYGRSLHYFVAIPIGWDRAFIKKLGKNISIENENELGVGGIAYAGIYREDASLESHVGVNLVRMINSVSFEFDKASSTFTVTPLEFTNNLSTFKKGVNREWEIASQLAYENQKSSFGVQVEFAHKSGLSAFGSRTQDENIVRIGVIADPVHVAQAIRKFKIFHRNKPDEDVK